MRESKSKSKSESKSKSKRQLGQFVGRNAMVLKCMWQARTASREIR